MSDFIFILGRAHNRLGGAAKTIEGYVEGLVQLGHHVTVAGLGSKSEIRSAILLPDEVLEIELDGSVTKVLAQIRKLRSNTGIPVIIMVGVWHRLFFIVSAYVWFSHIVLRRRSFKEVLIPTASLTPSDFAKHPLLKHLLRPVVWSLLCGQNGIVFSSTGEQRESKLARRFHSTVVLEPTLYKNNGRISNRGHETRVVFVGRLDPQKDIPLLLHAIRDCPKWVSLLVVGDGDPGYRKELQSLSVRLKIEERVEWGGWRDSTGVQTALQSSAILAVTSLQENFCHAAVEGVIAGMEVIVVNRILSVADFRVFESITSVPPSPEAIADAILIKIDTWKSRQELRDRSAEHAVKVLAPVSSAASLIQFCDVQSNVNSQG